MKPTTSTGHKQSVGDLFFFFFFFLKILFCFEKISVLIDIHWLVRVQTMYGLSVFCCIILYVKFFFCTTTNVKVNLQC